MVDQQHGEELVEAGTQNWDGWGLDYQAAVWGRASTMESSEQGVISPIGRLAHYKHNRKSVSDHQAQVQHWNTGKNVCFTSLLNCYFIYLWMNWKWVLVEWSPLVELPSFLASAQPAAPGPLLVGHPVLWNRGRSSKSGMERMQKMCSGPYWRKKTLKDKIRPLLTLWHGHWQTLRPWLFSNNWRFGHWDTNPPNVWVVPICAIVSTPVVIPRAADGLKMNMRKGMVNVRTSTVCRQNSFLHLLLNLF